MTDIRIDDEDRITTRIRARAGAPKLRRLLVGAVLIGFVSLVWYAFSQGQQINGSQVTPIIKADAEPFKVKPDQPGGMEIPHQDKMIYEELQGKSDGSVTEKLLPPPEKPIVKDSAADASAIPLTNSSPANLASNDLVNEEPESIGALPSKDIAPASVAPEKVAPAESTETKSVEPIVAPQSTTAEKYPAKSAAPEPAKTQKAIEKPASEIAPKVEQKSQPKVAAKPPVPGDSAKPVMTSGGKFRVQLASLPDKANADKMASVLSSKHKGILANHPVAVAEADIPGKGKFYRIQATGFADKAEASAMCNLLKNAGQSCIPVAP